MGVVSALLRPVCFTATNDVALAYSDGWLAFKTIERAATPAISRDGA